MKKIFLLSISCFLFACSGTKGALGTSKKASNLEQVTALMSGTFNSAEQAAQDSSYYDISLVMVPIWEGDKNYKWLYVEQAVSAMADKPYRQRVYQVSETSDGQIESKVFELPEPEKYIHAWENPALFTLISSEDLVERTGCSVFLSKNKEGCFEGATRPKECQSTLRGASYATSEVKVCAGQIVSWDQGWNADDEQVWGAVKGGYIFKKQK